MNDFETIESNARPTILVADDVDIGRQLLKKHLGKDFDIVEARNGREVIDIIQSSSREIACVLLDLLMPVMDGYKVLEFMREHGFLEHIPVIAVTAVSDTNGKLTCFDAGAVDIVEKPYDPKILQNRVHHYVSFFARLKEAQRDAQDASDARWSYYAAILDALPQAVFVFENATLRVKYCNAAFSLIPGVPSEATDKPLAEVFPPANYAAILSAVSNLLTTHVQRPLALQAGRQRFSVIFNAILDASGNVSDIIGTAVNITPAPGGAPPAGGIA